MDDRRPSAKAAVAAADAAGMAVAAIASVAGNTEQTAAGLFVCRRCAILSLRYVERIYNLYTPLVV